MVTTFLKTIKSCDHGHTFSNKKIYIFSRYPAVALTILAQNCKIYVSKCSCEQMQGGKCSHVACLLYLVQEVSLGASPRISLPSTSKQQYWGKGSKSARNPQPVQLADYGKKHKPDTYIKIDPRPHHLRKTSDQELFDFVKDNQRSNMENQYENNWDSIFKITYSDYSITRRRKFEIIRERMLFLEEMNRSLEK